MKAELEQSVEYLQSLGAIREECERVYSNIHMSKYYKVDESQLQTVAVAINHLITTDHQGDPNAIKPHGRWRHIPTRLTEGLSGSQMLDMFTVSVLLDAGAGSEWSFTDLKRGERTSRSEGIAVAVAHAFHAGLFSGDRHSKQVDAQGLLSLKRQDLEGMFQIASGNEMTGLEGRVELMSRLGRQLANSPIFATNNRPSGMIDYVKTNHDAKNLDINWFWKNVIIDAFNPVWPETRLKIDGESVGDVHFCKLTGRHVPFHKLSQWLCYSLLEPIADLYHFHLFNTKLQTGLAEYRNGGLFVDYQVILPLFDPNTTTLPPTSEAVVEWRALTVCLLDRLHRGYFAHLSLPQMLEAGTWKAGRAIAKQLRPTGAPPLHIQSDGTLF